MWEKYVRSQKMISISNNIYGILGSLKTDGMHYDISFFKYSASPKAFQKKKKKKNQVVVHCWHLLGLLNKILQNFADCCNTWEWQNKNLGLKSFSEIKTGVILKTYRLLCLVDLA